MPEPKDVHLPTLPETRLDEIDSEPDSKFSEQVHPSLLGLRAAQYKGTFKKAYSILTEMTAKIGWDQLLKIRSQVFVMEEEYRTDRLPEEKRNASIEGLRGTPDLKSNGTEEVETNGEADEDDDEDDKADEAGETASDAGASLEKPEQTVHKEEAKAGNEDVRPISPPQNPSTKCLLPEG
jgi:hypothetical protein